MKSFYRVWNSQLGKASLASLLIVSIAMLSFGVAITVPRFTKAAALTSVSDTLSTSAPGTVANHTILFVTPGGVGGASETIVLTFDSSPAFNVDAVIEDDVDIAYDDDAACDGSWTDITTVVDTADATNWGVATSSQAITFTHSTDGANQDIPAGRCVQIQIGSNATASGTGTIRIVNPTKVDVAGTADISSIDINVVSGTDTGTALVATIEAVTVSVTIDESLSLALAPETAANCPATLPGTDKSDDGSHTSTTISFGTLTSGNAFNHSCHLATISTNATDGYSTTIEKSALLTAGSDTIADGSCDVSCTAASSTVWATTTNNGFGYCLEDVSGAPAESSTDDWVVGAQCDDATPEFKIFPTTATTEPIMASSSPVSGDQIRMGVMLNYGGDQAAGTYTTTLTFIATPTF